MGQVDSVLRHGGCERLQGTGVSAGLVLGNTFRIDRVSCIMPDRKIQAGEIDEELNKLRRAMDLSKSQLMEVRQNLAKTLGADHAEIFDGYMMIVDDPALFNLARKIMETELCCIEKAFSAAIESFCKEMSSLDDEYLRERAADIRDIGERIMRNLVGEVADSPLLPSKVGTEKESWVIIADDLSPSAAARMNPERVSAFLTSGGSRTSHTAILARALGIPAIVAVNKAKLDTVEDGTPVALDGTTGEVFIRPDEAVERLFEERREAAEALLSHYKAESNYPVETLDGYQACLVANVELPSEALNVRQLHNVGIGLFRTEFLFINGMDLQDEEKQFDAYKRTVEAVKPYSVIFRTLDIGGDKFLTQLKMPHELNPFMGMRAIRFSLNQPTIFKTQLRAILRASAFGKVRVMFPMISTLEELESALKILDEVKADLKRDHIEFNDQLDVGCMIEVPAAAMLAEKLLKHLTFFSLGTNDLVQYSLAVDRSNPQIGYLYQPAHPSIIRMMKHVVDVATSNDKWVSVCGEMAGECLYTPLILGLGIHELSMSPVSLPSVRMVIRSIKMHEAEELVNYSLGCGSAYDVQAECKRFLKNVCPELVTKEI
ncbi:MAG: phosphoenolpyruvate--protein phosphotransferase [Victivallales bacterium]|nr:phosphoenolpyruvate--protein phosphotransferase [Victivallales bacterium]MBR6060260.1 phosphoenolpyruvate--protein phosphotransferase [Victivallales bacterium]